MSKFVKLILIKLVRIYQKTLSFNHGILKGNPYHLGCRFYPSCSEYFCQALEKHGVLKGFFMFLKRVLKCHPFSKGGYDPVK